MNVSILKKSVLAAAMLVAGAGWGASTWSDGKYTWYYNIANNVLSLLNYTSAGYQAAISPVPTGDIIIPGSIANMPVTTIGERALYQCTAMTNVTIPCSVQSIGLSAFAECSRLSSIMIPDSVTEVSQSAFSGCNRMTNAVLTSKLASIPNYMFSGCTKLESVRFPTNLNYIGQYAFQQCSISEPKFPNKSITFDQYAFKSSSVKVLTIPSGSTLRPYSFGWSSIQTVCLPKSVSVNYDNNSSDRPGPFYRCYSIREVTLPATISARKAFQNSIGAIQNVMLYDGATAIEAEAFAGFTSLTNIVLPSTVTSIGARAFSNCTSLAQITISKNVMTIDATAFAGCTALKRVTFEGDAPDIVGEGLFFGTPKRLEVRVPRGSVGWGAGVTAEIPDTWSGRVVVFSDEKYDWHEETAINDLTVSVVSTNVVVHYVFNSIQPEFAIPATSDLGFQNIVTEVKSGGVVSIPITWAMNYPTFTTTFGSDFTKALMQPTGKVDASGSPMLVWQDYVAGTDPTDEADVFTATITMVDEKPVISYTPELDDARKALRKYTVYGKVDLSDADWVEIAESEYANYHFFKVTVEMK